MKPVENYLKKQYRRITKSLYKSEYSWQAIYIITCISVCIYLFFEWLFIITKPSFFGSDGFFVEFKTLLFSTSLTLLAESFLILFLYFLTKIFRKKTQRIFKGIALGISAFIVASLALLLIDNFTYVVFDFGIVSTHATRIFYLLLFVVICAYSFVSLTSKAQSLTFALSSHGSPKKQISVIFLLTLIVCVSTAQLHEDDLTQLKSLTVNSRNSLSNIILITADGMDAQHMSAYDYSKETTPNIQKLMDKSLVAENAFTNSGNTAGSLISLYTGKYPTDTRLLFAPDILKNQDTIEHFIYILKSNKYSSSQFSYPYFADAYDLNLRLGFDYANGRSIDNTRLFNFLFTHFDSDQTYFLYQISSRLLDRLSHIFYIKNMVNLSLLANGNAQGFDDQFKFDTAVNILKQAKTPIFIHIHYLGTHGPEYFPKIVKFSAGKDINNQKEYDLDFYDDSILNFDAAIGQFIEELKMVNLYENSILIIGSDHGMRFTTNKRIPLIIHFPDDVFAEKINTNVQNIDIAPTILDYLNIKKPDWMVGDSLLAEKLENKPIFSFGIGKYNQEGDDIFASNNNPPFYQFGYININYCFNYFRLTFDGMKWESGIIEGYSGQCETITDEQAYTLMVNHLSKYGFNVSSLKGFSFVNEIK